MTFSGDAKSRAGFEGEVAGLGLTDLIQINARNGFSGSIRVQHGDDRGAVFFRDGDIVHAEQGPRTGEDAFCEIVSWQGGRFTVETNVVTALRTINKRCEHLLLEAHRLLDERRARGPAPAPAPRSPSETAVEVVKAVAGVTNAVLLTRTGARIGAQGYETEVLAGQTLFLGLLAGELGACFDASDLRGATVEGTRRHLLLLNSKAHTLGISAAPDADPGAVDAAVRAALTPRGG